jgi:M6 family metalloprotease-like protein
MNPSPFREARKIAVAALAIISLSAPTTSLRAAEAGDLVKGSLSAVYYVTADNKRLAFPDEATYFSWYQDFSQVRKVSDAEIAALPLVGLVTMRPGVRLVKIQSDPKVYAVAHGGKLRWLSTEAMARMIFGDGWGSKVSDISDGFLASYGSGDPITAAGQYWWKREQDASPTIEDDRDPSKAPVASSDTAIITSATITPAPGPVTVKNLLVLLWDPQEEGRVVPDSQKIDDLIFGSSKSVKGYYAQESGGLTEIRKAALMGWLPAKKPASHYWATPDPTDADGDGYVNGHNEKWAESILDADPNFDFASYDKNHDGALDPLTELGILVVIPSGSPFGTNRVVLGREYPSAEPLVVDGVVISMIAEWYTDPGLNLGVVTHEIGHLLYNLPDMYADGSPYRAGNYSLFDGSYCNCGLGPWEKGVNGWLKIATPPKDGVYELESAAVSHAAMKISRPGTDEFFLIENRESATYDSPLDPGLLVWDILKSSTEGDWGRDNIRLLRANGGTPLNDYTASYHAKNGVLDSTGELKWSDGTPSGVTLSDISAAGSTMRFTLTMK